VSGDRFELRITPTARGQLAEDLPRAIAFAAHEFITGPLLDNPLRVGKSLLPPLADRRSARRGTYRVIYRVDESRRPVTVVAVVRRADAYRT
jgi:mRNA interferase RelE/StbE